MGKKSINVWYPDSIAVKNDSSIYFDMENGFSLGKHKNAAFTSWQYFCSFLHNYKKMHTNVTKVFILL